jgi:hypothetical protein
VPTHDRVDGLLTDRTDGLITGHGFRILREESVRQASDGLSSTASCSRRFPQSALPAVRPHDRGVPERTHLLGLILEHLTLPGVLDGVLPGVSVPDGLVERIVTAIVPDPGA